MINEDQDGFYEGITIIAPDKWKAIEALNNVLGVSIFQFFNICCFSSIDCLCLIKNIWQHFLGSTKKMEGDRPTGALVLFRYSGLISVLADIKQTTQHNGLLEMITGMITQLQDYQMEALHCDPIVIATVLNPRL